MFSMASFRLRRIAWPLTVAGAAILVAPTVASAATGYFTSNTTTPAVTAINTGNGHAVRATAAQSTAIWAAGSGTGTGSAGYFRQRSTGTRSNGIYATSFATSGTHYGAWGVNAAPGGAGVYGQGNNVNGGDGVFGTATSRNGAGVWGDSPGVGVVGTGGDLSVLSVGDAGVFEGNVYDFSGGLAGTCNATAAANTCTFGMPFLDPRVKPVVVVTPQGDPGGSYWVTGASTTGFTLNLATAPAAPVVFGYQVVGAIPASAASSSKKAAAAKTAASKTQARR